MVIWIIVFWGQIFKLEYQNAIQDNVQASNVSKKILNGQFYLGCVSCFK